MSAVYDNWERLVEAVLKREEFRKLALRESLSSSRESLSSSRESLSSSISTDFSSIEDEPVKNASSSRNRNSGGTRRDGDFWSTTMNGGGGVEYPGGGGREYPDGGGRGYPGGGWSRKAPPVEKVLMCSLEDFYNGCTRKMVISRDVLDSHGRTQDTKEILTMCIKPGWKKGTKITFPEEGNEDPSVIPGDIIFWLDEKPHAVYTRDGTDLVVRHEITLLESLIGKTFELTTLDGRNITIPLTQIVKPGHEIVFPNEGMPFPKDPGRKGNLRIRIHIRYPERLTEGQKYELRKAFGGSSWKEV